MDARDLAIGDTVEAVDVFGAIDAAIERRAAKDSEIGYEVGTGLPVTRAEAERWVAESVASGCARIRYIVSAVDGRRILVELAAIEV